jgi:hypothetical protein
MFHRSVDTVTVWREKNWTVPRDVEAILQIERECKRLWSLDWAAADPFAGPLERFQWRVRITCFALL